MNPTNVLMDPTVSQKNVDQVPIPIEPPQPGRNFAVDDNVTASLPIPESKVLSAQEFGKSMWGRTAKLTVELPGGGEKRYFLKVVTLGAMGKQMCEGEYESLKAIYAVTPNFVPEPLAWGKYAQRDPETYFLLIEFRDIGQQVRRLDL